MRALSASELLDIWERGLTQPANQRALMLLAAACPETPPDALAELSVGQRDARLLTLRDWVFGPQVASLASCPDCGERLELTFSVADIQVSSPWRGKGGEPDGVLSLSINDYQVRFRLPNSLDLAAVSEIEEMAESRRRLLGRCLLSTHQSGQETSVDELPDDVLNAIVERMAEADPQAEVQLDLACPACTHRWQATFDILSFFWTEIEAWAYRTLREVHNLASAYGWREADILALSPRRRQFYLEMSSG
jgi:hypothetical protein